MTFVTHTEDLPLPKTIAESIAESIAHIAADTKPTNPKDAVGIKKAPLALCSPIAEAHWALAQYSGALKYQAWNWRIAGVRSSVYTSAIKRHLARYLSGEEFDPVDGTHHLGNIMACAAILLDARAAGKLNDDRPPVVGLSSTYEEIEKQMTVLRDKYAHIEQRPYTIKDEVVPDDVETFRTEPEKLS